MSQFFPDKSECSKHEVFPGVTIHTAPCRDTMLCFVEIAPGATVDAHSHPHEQVGVVLDGAAHFFIGDEDRVLKKGEMYRIPGGVEHRVVGLDDGATALDVFHPIRDDYL